MCKGLKSKISNIHDNGDGRLLIFDIITEGHKITIVAIYAPNQDNPEFFVKLATVLRPRQEKKILVGDYNLTLNVDIDRKITYCNNNRAKEKVKEMMEEFSLNDVWRNQNPDKKEYSWIKSGDTSKASRIDYELISAGLDQYIKNIMYKPGILTDHRALYIFLELIPFERGTGFWKFNTQLLKDRIFVEQMNQEIENTLNSTGQKTPCQTWEILKSRIKTFSKEYAKNRVADIKVIVSNFTEAVNDYESKLPLNKEEDELYIKTKAELHEKVLEKTKGIMFRSKVKWYGEGEHNTKYFFSLEKARYNAKTCYKIIDDDGDILENPHQVLEVQKKYYQDLYATDPRRF